VVLGGRDGSLDGGAGRPGRLARRWCWAAGTAGSGEGMADLEAEPETVVVGTLELLRVAASEDGALELLRVAATEDGAPELLLSVKVPLCL